MDEWQGSIAAFLGNVRVADLLDVLLVSALIYVVISWLRSGASRTVVMIVGVGVTLFVVANALSMYLTQMLLEGLFAVLVVTFVVLFQAEIRRELDRLAAFGLRWRRKQAAAAPRAYETLAETTLKLAQERTGALIVLRGREEIEPLVDGGVPLDAEVSETLLCSLFNPASPGHDGAVVVENERATRFRAHLPLSTNRAQIGPRGTRHAAALGMSERCDALMVVVSEERGEVSVAQGGVLRTLADPMELKGQLARFWTQKHAPPESRPTRNWQWKEAGVVAASVALATLFWAVLAYETEVVYRFWEAPVEYRNLPAGVGLEDPPTAVLVTVSGTSRALDRVDTSEVVLQLDLGRIEPGVNLLPIDERNLDLPEGVQLQAPSAITLEVRAVQEPRERQIRSGPAQGRPGQAAPGVAADDE